MFTGLPQVRKLSGKKNFFKDMEKSGKLILFLVVEY